MSFRNSHPVNKAANNPSLPPPPPPPPPSRPMFRTSSPHYATTPPVFDVVNDDNRVNSHTDNNRNNTNNSPTKEAWVEIIEPRSKTKIYANLDSGICAKSPPPGALVSRSDDFSDHWWELYDKKTGKFYYYNPDQQKTAWIKPEESNQELNHNINNNNNDNVDVKKRKRLLIIPVSKLQTFKKVIPGQNDRFDPSTVKCDASTQTDNSIKISISTQTCQDDIEVLEKQTKNDAEFDPKINHQNQHSTEPRSAKKGFIDDRRELEYRLQSIHFEDEDDDDDDDYCGSSNEINLGDKPVEESSEGWKSLTDHESPDSSTQKSLLSLNISQKSPIHCDTSSPMNSFILKNLIDDEIDPSSCKSQQLDHRKLVENFKKSRQTSLLGTHHDIVKSYVNRCNSSNNNNTNQKSKNPTDNYFTNHSYDDKGVPMGSDKHLRQLSALSTLPRPRKETKDKIAISKPEAESSLVMDADYDVVEENCGYYSDSEHVQTNQFTYKSDTKSPPGDVNQSKNSNFDRNLSTRGSTFSVESFARENLSKHAKKGVGLFTRKVKLSKMISWTKSGIKHPMISSVSSDLSSESISCFKLIQQFMGDREITMNRKYRDIAQNPSNIDDEMNSTSIIDNSTKSAFSLEHNKQDKNLLKSSSMVTDIASVKNNKHNNSLQSTSSMNSNTGNKSVSDRLRDEIAFELVTKGCSKSGLRDEIFIQLARQLTDNPSQESLRLGFILMSVLLSYFSPSVKFSPYILSFLDGHSHPLAKEVCLVRLNRRLNQNYPTYCRKPADGHEISIVRLSITKWPNYCGVFGESLERVMSMQTCSSYLKKLRLPWILTTLGKKLLETDGAATEGIFRCAADHDLIAQLRLEIDCVDFRKITDAKQVNSLLSNVQDPHVIAGLLKLFFRQLPDSVFPTHLYEICLQNSQDGPKACRIFNDHLSNLNKDIAAYLIRLLQYLSKPEQVFHTKMDNSNLSMVWAPNLLRAANRDDSTQGMGDSKWSISNWSNDDNNHLGHSQSSIFEQTRQEMQFIRSLITHLDTSFIDNIV